MATEAEARTVMKFLYLLVSHEKDIFLEQTLVSLISLRKHHPDACVALVVDDKTADTLVGFRATIKDLVSELIVIPFAPEISNKVRSRLLKTNMRNLLVGDFLYLDGDTVVVEPLNLSVDPTCDVAAVSDLHARENDSYRTRHKRFRAQIQQLQFSLSLNDMYYNSGVIFVRESEKAKAFFDQWHQLYLYGAEKGVSTDQLSFNETNRRLGFPIQELSGEWNCQVREAYNHLYRVKTIYPFLCKAKVIHFFGSGINGRREPHPLMKSDFFESLKKEQSVNESALRIIHNAKHGFYGAPAQYNPTSRFPLFFIYRQFPKICSAICWLTKCHRGSHHE